MLIGGQSLALYRTCGAAADACVGGTYTGISQACQRLTSVIQRAFVQHMDVFGVAQCTAPDLCCPCRHKVLLSTSQLQRIAKHYEDAAAGRYKRQVDTSSSGQPQQPGDAEAAGGGSQQLLQAELSKAAEKQSRLVDVLMGLQQLFPALQEDLEGVLAHAAAAEAWMGGASVTAR